MDFAAYIELITGFTHTKNKDIRMTITSIVCMSFPFIPCNYVSLPWLITQFRQNTSYQSRFIAQQRHKSKNLYTNGPQSQLQLKLRTKSKRKRHDTSGFVNENGIWQKIAHKSVHHYRHNSLTYHLAIA